MPRTRSEQYRRVNDARINELQARQAQRDLNPLNAIFGIGDDFSAGGFIAFNGFYEIEE